MKWDAPDDIATLQQSDPLLKSILMKILSSNNHRAQVSGAVYRLYNDILYEEERDSRRFVVPCITIPWAGHLGHHKSSQ